jgi:hypothetical protein
VESPGAVVEAPLQRRWHSAVLTLSTAGIALGRANLPAKAGRPVEAASMYGAASAQAIRLGGRWPQRALTAHLLREVRADLGAVVTPD